jgi:hypothetical protein
MDEVTKCFSSKSVKRRTKISASETKYTATSNILPRRRRKRIYSKRLYLLQIYAASHARRQVF